MLGNFSGEALGGQWEWCSGWWVVCLEAIVPFVFGDRVFIAMFGFGWIVA